ncbi:MAG: alpha/beta fold hydrolase [Pseudomonadota bacterium]
MRFGSIGRKGAASALALALSAAASLSACDWEGGDGRAAAGERPGHLATLPDGRRLNFHCTGRGTPLVLLEAGYGGGVGSWAMVQPEIARFTRVCAYDRAGTGFSDPGPLPRDGAAIARDLDQALDAAGMYGPFVLVGHSAGALYARLFAARRPGEVQGLVFADPTVERVAPSPAADGLQRIRQGVRRCLSLAEEAPAPPATDPRWSGCSSAPGPDRRPWPAEAWRNRLSELDSIYGPTSAQVFRTRGVVGDVPAYILTASETAVTAPTLGYGQTQSVWELQHVRMALDFGPGHQQTVLSAHRMPTDRPDAIVEAARSMVMAARAGTPPPPLPPSELAQPPVEESFGSGSQETP